MPNIEQVVIRNSNFAPLIASIKRVVEIPTPRTTVFCLKGSHRSENLAEWLFRKNIVSLTPNNIMNGQIIGCSYKHNIRTLVTGFDLAIFCFFDDDKAEDRYFRPELPELLANRHRIDVVTTGTTCYSLLELKTR